jgi:hypothetical protein
MAFQFLKARTGRDVFLHVVLVLLTAAALIIGFFNIYLPFTTNHGETITVPNLQGMHRDKLEDFLDERDLDYVIDDSSFHLGMPSFLVYQQYPVAGAKVKKGRKIYVSINSGKPELVKMPNLINRTYMNAQRELENLGLLQGTTKSIPDLQLNAVLKQQINGVDVSPGTPIAKGTRIDFVIGDGLSTRELDIPDLRGMPLDEAVLLLQGSGLQKGSVISEEDPDVPTNHVTRQKPDPGGRIREGDVIDIWVSGEKQTLPSKDEE